MKRLIWGLLTLLPTLGLWAADAGGTETLTAAYQREFVFLDGEIRTLQARQTQVKAEGEARTAAARKELQGLEADLLAQGSETARLTEELKAAEADAQKVQESLDLTQTILTQGNTRLASVGLPLFAETEAGKDPQLQGTARVQAELQWVFGQSVVLLERVSSLRSETGSFFLGDGHPTPGTVVKVGRIAAFASGAAGGGALVPGGQGDFRLANPEGAPWAAEYAAGNQPAALPLYLVQGFDKAVEVHEAKPLWRTVNEGGAVAWVIVAVLLVGFAVAGIRTWTLAGLSRRQDAGAALVLAQVSENDLDAALESAQTLPAVQGRVLRATVEALQSNPEGVQDAIEAQLLEEQPRLDRFKTLITVFVGAAPMLGLLGTVSGMIRVFDVLTIYGTSDPKLVSGGISEALVTTALGLSAAIPLLLVGSLLATWSERTLGRVEVQALRTVAAHRAALEPVR